MKQRSKNFFRKTAGISLSAVLIAAMSLTPGISASANPIKEKAIDQLVEDSMRLCRHRG